MKKIILFFLLPVIAFSQYVVADFIVLNNGTDSDYHKLEKVWSVYHQKAVDSGEKWGWSVWKRTVTDNDNDDSAHYVVFNTFSSEEQRDKTMKNMYKSLYRVLTIPTTYIIFKLYLIRL